MAKDYLKTKCIQPEKEIINLQSKIEVITYCQSEVVSLRDTIIASSRAVSFSGTRAKQLHDSEPERPFLAECFKAIHPGNAGIQIPTKQHSKYKLSEQVLLLE